MTWQQFLTEKMGECWHEWETSPGCIAVCKKCSASTMFPWVKNRTFDNRSDLMDLYAKAYEDGKWEEFSSYGRRKFLALVQAFVVNLISPHSVGDQYYSWLFCLNGKDYEPRCKMVAELYGWKDIMQTNFTRCKQAAEYWKDKYQEACKCKDCPFERRNS